MTLYLQLLTIKLVHQMLVLIQIDNEFAVKRFFKTSKGIRLVADNSLFKEITLQENSDLVICGIIKGISRVFS
jgi:SOS-response transcriptional repressor LexA